MWNTLKISMAVVSAVTNIDARYTENAVMGRTHLLDYNQRVLSAKRKDGKSFDIRKEGITP